MTIESSQYGSWYALSVKSIELSPNTGHAINITLAAPSTPNTQIKLCLEVADVLVLLHALAIGASKK